MRVCAGCLENYPKDTEGSDAGSGGGKSAEGPQLHKASDLIQYRKGGLADGQRRGKVFREPN